jgi:hypothetical protein
MDGGTGAVAGVSAGLGASAAPPPPPPNSGGFEAALQAPRQTTPPQPPEQFQPGPATGQTIARYDGRELRADARSNQVFGSQEAAIAYARSLDTPAAVIEEDGRYATYRVHAERGFFDRLFSRGEFSRDNAALDGQPNATNVETVHPGLRSLVTTDDFAIRANGAGTGALDRVGSPLGPFSSHLQAFGPGLERITDRAAFERQFEQAMRDTAFQALDDSQRAAEDIRSRVNGQDLTPEDRTDLNSALQRLAPLDRQIADKQREVDAARWNFIASSYVVGQSQGMSPHAIEAQSQAYDALKLRQAELAQLNAQRADAARDFPLVLRVDNLDQFRGMSPQDQTTALRGAADQVLRDIATTRSNIEDGDFNLWMMDGVRNTTAAGLGVTGERLGWVQDRAGTERRTDAAWKIGEAALTIGLAVGGAFFSGGASLALLGASAALGVHSATDVTSEYFRNSAAANTNLDPNAGLIPQDAVGHWGFVAAAWIGVGLDAAAVGSAIRALRAGQSIADAAKTLGIGEDALRATIRAAEVNDFRASVMGSEAFNARFGADAADAVTLLRPNGRGGMMAEIVTRGGIGPQAQAAAVREEMAHLQQLADPALASHFNRLSEENLARWSQMSPTERMEALRSQLTLEADAQRRMLQGRPPTESQRAALEGYEQRLQEVEQGLRDGKPPAWIADAAPPRLFSSVQYPETNAAARAAGYPEAPAGQFYRRAGNDYELTRFPPQSQHWVNPDTNPRMQVVRNGDAIELVPAERQLTTAERRAEFEARYGGRTDSDALKSAFDTGGLTAYQRAYARHYEAVFAELQEHGIAPSAVLNGVAGKTEAASGQAIRDNLRTAILDVINNPNVAPTERARLLQRFLDVQPSNGDRGELFSQFRAANPPRGVESLNLGPGSTTLQGTTRRADGALEVLNTPAGSRGVQPGTYLVEDKAGPGAFRPDQAERYSRALDAGGGQITAANGQQYRGLVYFFSNRAAAEAASDQVSALNQNIHVAYYSERGTVGWLR